MVALLRQVEVAAPLLVAVCALLGLVVGSFLNVVIVRLPHEDAGARSLRGRSRCPHCGAQIAWYDNLPLVSYVALRGRCRSCAAAIGVRYPLVELVTAALFAAVAWQADGRLVDVSGGDGWHDLPIGLLFVSLLVAITFVDVDHRIIPNAITYPGVVVGLAAGIALHPARWKELALAAFLAGFFLLVTAIVYPGGMGMGDVKLAALMGAFLGAPVVIAMFAGFLLGLLPSLYLLARHGRNARKMAIPFGPFLAGGGLIGWFAGYPLLHAYLATLGAN